MIPYAAKASIINILITGKVNFNVINVACPSRATIIDVLLTVQLNCNTIIQ
jgi:hypothetical protein